MWRGWFLERTGAWLIMLAVVCVAAPVILVERPRPSYLFPVTVFLMAVIGSAIHVLTVWRSPMLNRVVVVAVLALLAAIPSFYVYHRSARPLYTNYERLRPFTALMVSNGGKILLGDYNGELRGYLGLSRTRLQTLDYRVLLSWDRERSITQFLDENGIDVFFVQPRIFHELQNLPQARALLGDPETVGWQRVTPTGNGEPWALLFRQKKTLSERP